MDYVSSHFHRTWWRIPNFLPYRNSIWYSSHWTDKPSPSKIGMNVKFWIWRMIYKNNWIFAYRIFRIPIESTDMKGVLLFWSRSPNSSYSTSCFYELRYHINSSNIFDLNFSSRALSNSFDFFIVSWIGVAFSNMNFEIKNPLK